MTIREAEEQTGLSRSNIRFYEKEELINPNRLSNGYRDYSEEDVNHIKKIAYLRTLGISVDDIRAIINGKESLHVVLKGQTELLNTQISELESARYLCRQMLGNDELSYESLNVDDYVERLPEYWNRNRKIIQIDAVGFMSLWGGTITWFAIAACSLILAVISLFVLPTQIPIQWNDSKVTSEANKFFIFAYPAVCMLIRMLLRPIISNWLYRHFLLANEIFTDYVVNALCFVFLSLEIFAILYTMEIMRNVLVILAVDGIVFLGVFVLGLYQYQKS